MIEGVNYLYGFGPETQVLFLTVPGKARALVTDPSTAPYVVNLVTGERIYLAPAPETKQ